MRRPTLRHHIEGLGYRVALGLLRLLPEGLALRLGEGMGWVAGVLLGVRRRTVREHLRQAFPNESEAWRRRLARASFRSLGREFLATFLLGRASPEEVLERTQVVGLPSLQEALEKGKGAIAISAHFGNWEIAGASVALRGVPLDAVVQRQRNPLFDVELNETRRRLGITVIYRSEATKEVLRSLRKGRVVGILADQNVRRGGVFVDFFGKKAATARGPAIFALRTGCPIFLGLARRVEGSPTRYRTEIVPVEFAPSGDMEEDVLRLTEAYTRYLEQEIVRAPEQYFWQHRRWKTRPPEEMESPGSATGDSGL
jgi:KDO2-lipid IV(A) lauroyltransferase